MTPPSSSTLRRRRPSRRVAAVHEPVAGVQHAHAAAHPEHPLAGDVGRVRLAVRLAVELEHRIAADHQRAVGFGQGGDGLGLGPGQQQGGVVRIRDAVAGLDGVLVDIGDEDLVPDAGVGEQLGAGGGLGGKNEAGHRSSLVHGGRATRGKRPGSCGVQDPGGRVYCIRKQHDFLGERMMLNGMAEKAEPLVPSWSLMGLLLIAGLRSVRRRADQHRPERDLHVRRHRRVGPHRPSSASAWTGAVVSYWSQGAQILPPFGPYLGRPAGLCCRPVKCVGKHSSGES